MAGKTRGAAQPKKGKGNARTALSELDPNVQLSRAGSSGGDTPHPPTAPRRSSRQAVKEAGFYVEIPENPVVESPPRHNVNARSKRPGSSLPTRRFLSDSDEDFPLESPPRDVVKGKGRPVPAVPDSDVDFPLSEGSDDDISDLDDIDEERILCPENGDVQEDEYELSDQSDSDFDQEETAPLSAKAKGKRPVPVKKVAGSRRAPKRARPAIQVTAEQWLKQVNKRYGIKPNDKNVLRFQEKMTQLVHRLSDIVRDAGSFQKVAKSLAKSTYKLFESADRDEICSAIFAHMPLQTQAILGKPDLQAKDLLRLPEGVTQLRHMGTYLDVLGKYPQSCIEIKPHPDYTFKVIKGMRTLKALVDIASATEFGLYDGSSYGKDGLMKRAGDHLLEMNRPDSDKKSSAVHYTLFGNHHDAVANFRLTSIWDQGGDRRYPVLVEGLVMTYLGLQNDGEDGRHHPSETYEMNRKLRGGLELPDFMSISLNRAWPLFQGLGLSLDESKELAIRNETKGQGCANPGHNPRYKKFNKLRFIMTASGEKEWRCNACQRFMKRHDGRDCSEEDYVKPERVCGNPRHPSERFSEDLRVIKTKRNGSEVFRCDNCYLWFHKHGREWPITKDGEDITLRPAPGSRTCENPNHPPERDIHLRVSMSSIMEGLRCVYCKTWARDNGCDYPITKTGEDFSLRPAPGSRACENPTHPEHKDASDGVHHYAPLDADRCRYCASWFTRAGHDYPINKAGEDVTALKAQPKVVLVCGNPDHPEGRDASQGVSNSSVVNGVRCSYCYNWVYRHGHDYPINTAGEDVTTLKPQHEVVLVCGNPDHPEDRDAYHRVSNSSVMNGVRCSYCYNWAYRHGHDYPIKKNG